MVLWPEDEVYGCESPAKRGDFERISLENQVGKLIRYPQVSGTLLSLTY